jgi:hypothetical protein
MKKVLFSTLILLIVYSARTQNVGIGTSAPNASAQLHINSSNKGILIPQVSLDSLKDVTSIPSPAQGLIVYNTTQPGAKLDMARGYYYYSTNALSWVRFSDNLNDNPFVFGGTLGIKLRDTADAVEIMDGYTGTSLNYNPKLRVLKKIDSVLMNTKNNIPALVITGVNKKTTPGWEFRQKTSIIFENNYLVEGNTAGRQDNVAISAYTENTGTTQTTQTQGLAFYVTAPPHNIATADTPSVAMFRHNVGIGAYPTDINNVNEGRLQITGYTNVDQLSLRHPSSSNTKWGFYVNGTIDSALYFYYNGSLRASIDRLTGAYTTFSDRNKKKNIRPLSPVLDIVRRLPVYSYNYLDSKDEDRRVIGVMAQDVQPYFPELVYQRYDREITKPVLTLDYSGMGVLAIKAIQEQQVQIEEVKAENNLLKKQIQELLNRLAALEKK